MILVIDNYDSFTYNLVQMIGALGSATEVVRNDAISVADTLERRPDGVVLSPGPGRPEAAGVCMELLSARPEFPVLGVCLGHQALAAAFGAVIEPAPQPMHGKVSEVRHTGVGIFSGLPNPFEATRYHSLIVRSEDLPAELEPVAWSAQTAGEDGSNDSVQGVRHQSLPYWGVQFHPESVLTRAGSSLMSNFLELCGVPDVVDS